ncbi:MAG: MFS transporter [Clostridia bacterium]|nr:MFS transporter [Clostridia bacterium]
MKSATRNYLMYVGCLLLCLASLYLNATAPFIYTAVVCDDLGLNRSLYAITSTIRNIAFMLLGFKLNSLLRRFGFRIMLAVGAVLTVLTLVLFCNARTLPQFYVFGLSSGVAHIILSVPTFSVLIGKTFDKNVGTKIGIVAAASGVTGIIFNPILANIVEKGGWRAGFRFATFVTIILCAVGYLLFFLNYRPAAEETAEEKKTAAVMTDEEKKRLATCCVLMVLCGLSFSVLFSSNAVILQGFGYTALFATGIAASVHSFCNCGMKILMGRITDKVKVNVIGWMWATFLVIEIALYLLTKTGSIPIAIAASAMSGAGACPITMAMPILANGLFSSEKASAASFRMTGFYTVGTIVSGQLVQMVYTPAHGYSFALYGELVIMILYVLVTAKLFMKKVN